MTTLIRPALLVLVLLVLSACAGPGAAVGSGDSSPLPVEPDGGIGDGAVPPSHLGSTPIPVEPDGGIGDGAGPPDALSSAPSFGIASETDDLVLAPYTSCWTDPATQTGICADGRPDPGPHAITGADRLVVTYAEGTLTAEAGPEGPHGVPETPTTVPVAVQDPGIFILDISALPAGQQVIALSWNGPQGDSHTAFTLDRQP